jgi:hypothetical protein
MNARKNESPRLEAAAAYEAQHMTTSDYLARIENLLGDMPLPEEANWGHVGTLAMISADLARVAAFLESAIAAK